MQGNAPPRRGKPFLPGNRFGRGRPPGSRNKVTRKLQLMLEEAAPGIGGKFIKQAKKGEYRFAKWCLEHVVPALKETPINLDLPEIHTSEDVLRAFNLIMQAAVDGRITSEQTDHLTRLLALGRQLITDQDLSRRLEVVENRLQEMKESHEPIAA